MPKFLSNIDLNDNEIQNVRIHNLGTLPAYGSLTTAQQAALKGEVIYHTQDDKLKFWDGGNWVELGASTGGSGTFDDFFVSDDQATPNTTLITDGNTLTIAGGTGINSVVTANSDIVTISGTDATASDKGIATFNASDFTVTNGDVTIKNLGVATGQIADDAVTYVKIQNVATANRVLGSTTANGVVSELQVTSDMIANGTITNDDINGSANIADTKLNTISTADKVSLSALNIDGATDIGAALVSTDLIIVDDGASGTNRKSTIARLGTLLQGTGLGLSGATLSVTYGTGPNTALEGNTAVDNVSVGNLKTALGSDLGGTYTIGDSNDTGTVAGNFTISGNLTVNGTTTSVNSNEVNIGDSFILLNSDATGTPADSQDAGIEIERGDSTNVSLRWDELEDDWEFQAFNHAATPVLTTYKISRTFTATIGGATQSIVNHNLGTRNIIVQLFDTSSYETVYAEVTRDTTNRILVDFAVAPTANDVTVLITTV